MSELRPRSHLRLETDLPPALPMLILLGLTNYHLKKDKGPMSQLRPRSHLRHEGPMSELRPRSHLRLD